MKPDLTKERAEKLVFTAFRRRLKGTFAERVYASLQLFETHCPSQHIWLGLETTEEIKLVHFSELRKEK